MKRSQFLKSVGAVLVLPAALPFTGSAGTRLATKDGVGNRSNCVLIPSETAGPFPLDLSENEFSFVKKTMKTGLGCVETTNSDCRSGQL